MSYFASSNRYNQMKYKRCGNSGLLLPSVSLGLWHNFGEMDDQKKIRDILYRAFDLGITHFDLANNYGPPPGSAETNLKHVLSEGLARYRDELIISTKAGYNMWEGPYGEWGSRKYMISSLDQSLKRMGIDYVDIFYSHRPDPDTPMEETMGALHSAVQMGKALYVGISNYDAEQTLRAVEILANLGTPCLIHQPKYNMLNRWVEDELLEVLEEKGVGCIPFSPLAQGLLTDRYIKGIPEGSRIAGQSIFLTEKNLNADLLTRIKALNQEAELRGQTLAQMALAWILSRKQVSSVLIGASSVSQLEANVATIHNLKFTSSELDAIDNILS
ncbi:MAG: L-glyceraldehyde 3-phosphate reductase [Bacteroidetes bacterium]|nr:L-glyceraldehyde 3-phosphate reductase [Bacteroidota bacterium]